MMKCIIIEDEFNARAYLKKLISKYSLAIEVCAEFESVEQTVNWFRTNKHPDIVFMDIQLSDGKSFEIFNHIQINAPIIFTTAYDEYAINAFKYNSIDYLLKPFTQEDLNEALDKYRNLEFQFNPKLNIQLLKLLETSSTPKKRILLKKPNHFEYINTDTIPFIVSEQRLTFIYTPELKRHVYNDSLTAISEIIDGNIFFMINRSQIINANYIYRIHPYFNQRMKIELNIPHPDFEFIVNRTKLSAFKEWIEL